MATIMRMMVSIKDGQMLDIEKGEKVKSKGS